MKTKYWIHCLPLAFFLIFLMGCSKESEQIAPGENEDYRLFVWNDLGMHCLNPSYDQLVILPPYNNLMAQVIKRGNPPQVITDNITLEYRILNNTSSADKAEYGGFWQHAVQLFGSIFGISSLPENIGLTGNGLSGNLRLEDDHFIASGIPVTPLDDDLQWNPYQVAEISLKINDALVMKTQATVPTSDEINCAKCHGQNAFNDILAKHDASSGTQLLSSQPVLCASCHGSPALGLMEKGSSGMYLSEAIHGYHADKDASCYDCHPGNQTQCNRSIAHTAANGNCTTCHGDMIEVSTSIQNGRIPWVSEPKCSTCHSNIFDTDTGQDLYRNAKGHGDLYCTACHGSPHAMYPSKISSDNYQSIQYQPGAGKIKTIGSCGVCHSNSRGASNEIDEFNEVHGGSNPEVQNSCHVCHTVVSANTADWPHRYQWTNTN